MNDLLNAIRASGINPPTHINQHGITRFATTGKEKSGWVSLFIDGKGACYGDWKSGEQHVWFADGFRSSENDYEREQAIEKAKEERDFAYSNAAFNAQELYAKLPHALDHDYLTRKNVKSHAALRIYDGKLVIPVYGVGGEIQSLQYISTDGTKRFYTGGKMQGGYFTIGEPSDMVIIAEGFATAMTIHEATAQCVVVAFNAGNLKPVCDMVRSQYKGRVIICADNDASGVGIEKANKCGVEVIHSPIVGEDFNDMAKRAGISAVADFIIGQKQNLFVSVHDLMANTTRADWVIKNLLERGSNTLLFGESGACKSLIAMDWAFCIGNGIPWHGHKTKKGTVVVIAGEGHRGLAMRMQALKQKYNMNPDNIYFSTKSVNLLDTDAVMRVASILDGLGLDEPPCAIFIDTMHRNMHGDENSSEDMAIFLANMELLAKKYNAAIVPVHHSGHGDKGRARGSSAIKAGMDAEFCMTKKSKMEVTLSCTKSKDFSAGNNMDFRIKVVDLEGDCFYDDDEGKQIEGVYLEYVGVGEEKKELSDKTKKTLDGLKMAVEKTKVDGKKYTLEEKDHFVVTLEQWKPFAFECYAVKNTGRHAGWFREGVKTLIEQGLVENNGQWYWEKI
jgi:phage/plasmid primase-like uncharacterized protein